MPGPTLLKTYVTPVGTDEASPRVITFDVASTPLRTIVAMVPCSAQVNVASPWAVLDADVSGTSMQIFYLPGPSNSGATSLTITQTGPAYPFAALIFEDDIGSFGPLSGPGQVTPATTWNNINTTFGSFQRTVAYWTSLRYQNAPVGDISAYSNGLTEIADTGVSSTFNSSHVEWYSCRAWAAWVDSLTGTLLLNATSSAPTASTGWVGNIQYTVVLPSLDLTAPTATVAVAALVPGLVIALPVLTLPTASISVIAREVIIPGASPEPEPPEVVQVVTMGGAQPTNVKNVVTIGRADIPTDPVTEAPPPTTVRAEGSIARYRTRRYERTDLTHNDDGWSAIVATAILGTSAFPSAAPRSITLDSRQHPLAPVPEILLSVEPDMALTVFDRAENPWRELVAGWEVQVGIGHIEGTITLNDVTNWDSGLWDSARWDIDHWGFLTSATLRRKFPWLQGE